MKIHKALNIISKCPSASHPRWDLEELNAYLEEGWTIHSITQTNHDKLVSLLAIIEMWEEE